MKENIRVSLAFTRLNDEALPLFGAKVRTDLYSSEGVAAYPDPPATAEETQAAVDAFQDAKVAQANGGRLATAEKNARREELVTLLKRLASYVQMMCGNDLPTLLLSGYDAVSRNHTREPLARAAIRTIKAGPSGVMLVTTTAQRNARGYELRMAEVDENHTRGPWGDAVLSSSSRNIPIGGQIPGRLYAFQARAFGSTGFAEWSDVVVNRAV